MLNAVPFGDFALENDYCFPSLVLNFSSDIWWALQPIGWRYWHWDEKLGQNRLDPGQLLP
jgi:hypothetical protein